MSHEPKPQTAAHWIAKRREAERRGLRACPACGERWSRYGCTGKVCEKPTEPEPFSTIRRTGDWRLLTKTST